MVRSGGQPTASANLRVVSQNVRGLLSQVRNTRERKSIKTYKRNNKHARCVRAAVPVSFPPAIGRVLVQFSSEGAKIEKARELREPIPKPLRA